ncbi:MAG: hypothetical protein WAT21_01745 [Saprospiraceae bacterium]
MSRIIHLLALLLLFETIPMKAQYAVFSGMQDVRSSGMARTGLTIFEPLNFINNPSRISDIQHSILSVQSRPYSYVSGLYSVSASALYKSNPREGFGIKWQSEGSRELNENIVGICYGRKVGKSSGMALGFNYFLRNLPESKNEGTVIPEISLHSKLNNSLSAAALVINPIPIQIKKMAPLPTIIRLGIGYQLSSKLNFQLEVHKTSLLPVSGNVGLEYLPVKNISIRSGCTTRGQISFGIGYQYRKSMFIDSSVEYFQVIGPVMGLGINYLIL